MQMKPLRLLIPAAALLLAAGGCSRGYSDDGYSAGAPASSTGESSTGQAVTGATVAIAHDGNLGDHLVGPDGLSLYLFEKDEGVTTACTGSCVATWPPLTAEGAPTAGDGVGAAELSTANGIVAHQVTYHGHLLYFFAGDSGPGDTKGTSVPSWDLVAPNGDAILAG